MISMHICEYYTPGSAGRAGREGVYWIPRGPRPRWTEGKCGCAQMIIVINSKAAQQSVQVIYSVSCVQGDAGQPGVPGELVGGVCLYLNTENMRAVVSAWLNGKGLVFVLSFRAYLEMMGCRVVRGRRELLG